MQIRYIFGCNHKKRNNFSTTLFEKGLEIPCTFCNECFTCNICLKLAQTKKYEFLNLCEECQGIVLEMLGK